jgi:hypothetical protein
MKRGERTQTHKAFLMVFDYLLALAIQRIVLKASSSQQSSVSVLARLQTISLIILYENIDRKPETTCVVQASRRE